jgi:hypothetical protein
MFSHHCALLATLQAKAASALAQQLHVHYDVERAPTARYTTSRLLLTIALQFDNLIRHVDVKPRLFSCPLDEQVFYSTS